MLKLMGELGHKSTKLFFIISHYINFFIFFKIQLKLDLY